MAAMSLRSEKKKKKNFSRNPLKDLIFLENNEVRNTGERAKKKRKEIQARQRKCRDSATITGESTKKTKKREFNVGGGTTRWEKWEERGVAYGF